MHARQWVNGEWFAAAGGAEGESVNPASGEALGRYSAAGRLEAEQAIATARAVFEGSAWAHQPRLRAALLLELAARIEAVQGELAQLLTAENGKILAHAAGEVAAGVSELRYYAGLARNIFGRVLELDRGMYSILAREPMGVAGIIVPWNAPVTLLVRSLAPALAAGCTVAVKAAHQTALTSDRVFRELAACKSLPRGVVNMFVESGSDGAKALVASPEVDVLSYTGSSEVGKQIMAAAAGTLKRLNLELGGSAPCVIYDDADLDRAVPALVAAGMVSAGQQCVAASRLIVHERVFDRARVAFQRALSDLAVGPGLDPKSRMGPMIDRQNRDRILRLVQGAKAGHEVVLEGRPLEGAHAKGAFVTPSLIQVKEQGSALVARELFGPVLTLDRFASEEEAVEKANRTRFGLAASVWSRDLAKAQRAAARIKAGTVWINLHGRLSPEAETGGYRESGFGRLHGVQGLEEFLQTKHISYDA